MLKKIKNTNHYNLMLNYYRDSLSKFKNYYSFTLEIWLYVVSGGPLTAMPVFCSASHTVCLWLENTQVYGQYRNTTINSAAISTDQWTNIVFQYDESGIFERLT